MIVETQPNFQAYFNGPSHCAYCGGTATRLLNLPGNIVAPACNEPGCPSQEAEGAIEVRVEAQA